MLPSLYSQTSPRIRSACFAAAVVVSTGASAQTSTFLDFYTNTVPTGWGLTQTRTGTNFGIANGRYFSGAFNSSSTLSTVMPELAAAKSVYISWDGNIARSTGGGFAQGAVQFGPANTERFMTRWSTYSWLPSLVYLELGTPNFSQSVPIVVPLGNYRFAAMFADDKVTFSGSLGGVEQFRTELPYSGDLIRSSSVLELYTYQYNGPDVWMDNVWITTTPVPEPGTLAYMLSALGVLRLLAKRRRDA